MQKHADYQIQKIAAAFLAILFFFQALPVGLAASVENVQVTAASLTSNASAMNGMVRVYLSSMGSPTTLNLTIAGSYSINGDTSQSLASGSTATVEFSSSTGAITLTANGSRTNMGTYFALRRHSTSGSNGIQIDQAKVSANPYPGDLSFQAVRQSSGSYKLYTVAHIYIENYLYGVLPYEMGNSSNIEALKAQAVAARTYTVRMMQSRSSGYYDVVDTTSDQVYRGTPSGNANCVAAVDATKGIVLKNGSSYTMTYYSASNGGQTESVKNAWGTSGYDYLTVKDDPFDYANTSSTVKSKTVYMDLTSASNPSGLLSLLKTKAVNVLRSSGYNADASNVTLKTLNSVTPHTPKYASPSKLYTKMDFAMTAQTLSAAGAVTTASVTVTCDIFSELESLLSMSIQSSQNELWSVKKNSSSFTLQARRYGHGLGMSQRGAMYMGKLGYTYDEILGFYYNNCQRVRQSFTNTILSAGSSNEETTIEDAAELPQESGSACKGTVKLVSSGTSLAIRTAKSTTAGMIGALSNGAIVNVLQTDGTWCYIQYGALKGYVPANALSISGTPSGTEGEATAIIGFVTVTAGDYVNLRQSASMSAAVLSTAPNGAVLSVFSTADGWAQVQYCATTAYANMSYLSTVTTTYPSTIASTGSATAVIKAEVGTVNLRSTASTEGAVLLQLPSGAEVTVTSDDGSWATVVYNGQSGYVMSSYLNYSGDSLENNAGGNTTGDTGGGTAETVYATVSAELSYLREQPSAEAASRIMLAKGDSVQVTDKGSDWCAAVYEQVSGYIPTAYLSFSGGEAASVGKAVVTTVSGSLNLRAQATAGSQVLTTIPRNTEIDVTSIGGVWCGVRYNGINGYVMSSFLTFTQGSASGGTAGSDTGSSSTGETTAVVTTQSGSLNLRAEARSGSTILRTIPQYATVQVHSRASDWCSVTYLDTTGYVMTVFLTFAEDSAGSVTPTPSPTPDPNATPSPTPDPNATLSPTPDASATVTPSPAPTNGAVYAVVSTASGSLNMRMDAFPGSPVLTRIPRGETILVTQRLSAWSQTVYNGQTGYVMNTYLRFAQDQPAASGSGSATVTTQSGSLNLRAQPSAGAEVIAQLPQYAIVTVREQGSEWCSVTYGSLNGYVMSRFLTFSATTTPSATPSASPESGTPSPSPTPTAGPQTATVVTQSGSLNLREYAKAGSQVLAVIPRHAIVTVLTAASDWCQVTYNGITGYVMSQYLSFSTVASTVTATPTATPVSVGAGSIAWVMTNSGSLNLRQSPDENAQVLAAIPQLSQVIVLEHSDAWSSVCYGAYTGYVQSVYLTSQDPSGSITGTATPNATATPSATPTPTPASVPATQPVLDSTLRAPERETYAFIDPREDQEMLMLWPECVEGGTGVISLLRGIEVQVLMLGDTWCQVQYQEHIAYALTNFLSIQVK
ncbi:MAG: SH3 domain-containing protein [Eubacteriales bacterium]|nr:SH3 domain-containing protein [Eubacteriales bacterium]